MSSTSVHHNSESVSFQISGSDVNTFYETSNGQAFTSKLLSINKIQFQIYIYPNGIDKKQIGNIQFIVVPNKFDSSIKCVAVCCKLYCPNLQLMFKQLKLLQKHSDTIDWCQFQLSDQNIIKNDITFKCDIEVLKIKYKSNSSTMGGISRKLSLHAKRKHSRANSLSTDMNLYVFQTQTFQAKSQVNIEWIIKNKLTHHIYSQDINNMWCLSLCPNKSTLKNKNNGNVELTLKLLRFPHPEIRSIEVDFTVQITGGKSGQSALCRVHRRNISFSYNKSTETSKLFEINKLDECNTFKLKMNVNVIRIFEDVGRNIYGKEIKDNWHYFNFDRDEFQPETFQCNTDYGYCKNNEYDIDKDDMKSFYSSTEPIDDVNENILTSTSKSANSKSNIKKSIYKDIKEPQRKLSYSNTLAPPTSTTSYRNSITSYIDSSHRPSILHNIAENKVDHVPWDIEANNIENKQQYETKIDGNMFNKKFDHWLRYDVQMKEYLPNFVSNGCADIRSIEDFDDKTLIDIGINNKHHRKVILKEVKKFVEAQNDLEELMKKHQILKSFKKTLQENQIWTMDELQSIQTEQDLADLLKIVNTTNECAEIWRIIKMAPFQLQINQLQERCKLIKQNNGTFFEDAMKMYKQLEENDPMQQQVISILNEYFVLLKNQFNNFNQSTPNPNINTRLSGGSISSYSGPVISAKIRVGNNSDSIPHSTSLTSSSGQSDDTESTRCSHGDTSNTSGIIGSITVDRNPHPPINRNPWIERDNKQ